MGPALAPISVPDFQARWRNTRLSERSAAQSHFIELCALLGAPTPAAADQTGDNYSFERPVRKLNGKIGFADVWRREHFVWEYKRRGANLAEAFEQIHYYRDDLENPPLLIVSDIERIEIRTNFNDTPSITHTITLDELSDPEKFKILRAVFHNPKSLKPEVTIEAVTKQAAESFASLAAILESRGADPQRVAHFLVQVLFCLFAEDIGLLEDAVFSKLLAYAVDYPEDFPDQMQELLEKMRDGGTLAYRRIPRFNGGLFAQISVVPLTQAELKLLVQAAQLDWGSIEPAIFGTLFERSLDPAQRRKLGAHYTRREDIELVVEPVLVAPLRRRWDAVQSRATELKARWDAAPNRQERARRRRAFRRVLTDFQHELTQQRILDPACGSGNFLFVALAMLHDLEYEVSRFGANSGITAMLPLVSPTQLFGLEVNPYARELAQVVVWIGHLQWMRAHGFGLKKDPVIDSIETIEIRDALIQADDTGQVCEAEWPEADFIIGNPPFLGAKKLRSELDDEYVENLFSVYRDRVPGMSDLVCYFFEKARGQIASGHTKRAGLLATNSIRGGASRRVLERVKESGDIFMAWDDEPWILDGAAVRISIVGFDDGIEPTKMLDGEPVLAINADLTSQTYAASARKLGENSEIAFIADVKGGKFEIPALLAREWMALPANPNGRTNEDVLRPWVNGIDIIRRPRGLWIIDFGENMAEPEAALYEAPFEYVRAHVRPKRQGIGDLVARRQWWRHTRPVPGMRRAVSELPRYIATLTVAKHRVFVWLSGNVLADHQLVVFARADDYFFGVLHSWAHEVWSLRMGTSLEDRPRYTPTTCFETFPMPWPPGQEPQGDSRLEAIGHAARELNEFRERWLNPADAGPDVVKHRTLTNLYNAKPTWLINAHAKLDRAVWAAYGWEDEDPKSVDDDTILARLLALNLERSTTANKQKSAAGEDVVLTDNSVAASTLASRENLPPVVAANLESLAATVTLPENHSSSAGK